jgi:hypothetical protein
MKKLISILLTVIMLVSFSGAAMAENTGDNGFSPKDVLQWLDKTEKQTEDVDGQLVNGAYRLAQMLVCIDTANADEEQSKALDDILKRLSEANADDSLGLDQRFATGAIQVVQALEILAHQMDKEGKNGQIADNFKAEFLKNDEAISTPSEQAVNALYSAVKFAALAAEECCTSQDMVDQIEEGLTQVGQEDAAASTVGEKLVVGSKWLFKMLGAFTKLQGEDKIQSIENITNNTEAGVANAGPLQATATWLYSCVYACGVLTGAMTVD